MVMGNWKQFCELYDAENGCLDKLNDQANEAFDKYGVYPHSVRKLDDTLFFIATHNGEKFLVVYGQGDVYDKFSGTEMAVGSRKAKVCAMDNENCRVLRGVFDFTSPVSHHGHSITLGLGDRLGLASPGHIRLIKDKQVFPVLAQQSIRELNLTGRTYEDVLSAASWAVFQEGYTSGFGADGDHLKTPDEVKMALDHGFTMITLDCSEHIDNGAAELSAQEADKRYSELPEEERKSLETKYLGKKFSVSDNLEISFEEDDFKKIVLVYAKAVKFAIEIYNGFLKGLDRKVDFEMSVDETLTSTTPEAHFFVASELINGGVEITSLAPRFCGEFQKGIDYIGDVDQFTREFGMHAAIAEHFGYKLSVHSGSDKFTVFPIVGKLSNGKYHLKTAGTNWLEAVRIIAAQNPSLYRRMHKFAVANLDEAKKYYHIGADVANIPDIDTLEDSQLPGLMDKDDSRQVLHITYGLLLLAKNPDGTSTFRDEIYSTLNRYEAEYYEALERHIGRHLKELSAE
jgi:hypothetical protein